MELANEVMYIGFGLIFFGLSFNSFHDLKVQFTLQSSRAYWAFSLIAMTLSCLFYALYPYTGAFILTLGNITQVAVDVGLALLFRTLNTRLKKALVTTLLLSLLPLGVLLEFIRLNETYDIRVDLLSWIGIALSFWQMIELLIQNRKKKSIYLSFIILAIGIQIILWFYRIWIIGHYDSFIEHSSLFDEHTPEFVARLILIVLYALIFIGIGNYYYDQLVVAEKSAGKIKKSRC